MQARLWWSGFVLTFCRLLCAQATPPEYCAFEVAVQSTGGAPVTKIRVLATTTDSGFRSETVSDKQGIARICEAPIQEPLNLQVGDGGCSVQLREVYPLWRETRKVTVTYQPCGPEELAFNATCYIRIRVRDQAGHPLKDATLLPARRITQAEGTAVSDSLGRFFWTLPRRSSFEALVEKLDVGSRSLTLSCGVSSPMKQELDVVLP